ncbi:MAG: Sapep family Mn(2+)-dependent dipeptidase, partial [Tissierellia bacterium]|nr:Sapep family Mn(2+)-dependent dipeptidase [Tissierellia bacterium]
GNIYMAIPVSDIKNEVEGLFPEYLEDLKKLVAISSKEGERKEGMPFGEEINNALNLALSMGENMGFETKKNQGYYGYVKFGDSLDYIGVFGHLDVVPEGTGWTYPPFGCEIADGKIYGRGVLDNKGPILACLYALQILKNLGWKPKKEIRIVFGTNEETGFKDMEYYLSQEKEPITGFTPDNKFPAIYGEKGRVVFHGSFPFKCSEDLNPALDQIAKKILPDSSGGKALGFTKVDQDFGAMEIRGYELFIENQELVMKGNLVLPALIHVDEAKKYLEKELSLFQWEYPRSFETVNFGKNSKTVSILTKAFEDFEDLESKPLTTTGGTYAKIIPNIIPFGPSFPGQKGIGHLPDEWMNLVDLKRIMRIYARGIYLLEEGFRCTQ